MCGTADSILNNETYNIALNPNKQVDHSGSIRHGQYVPPEYEQYYQDYLLRYQVGEGYKRARTAEIRANARMSEARAAQRASVRKVGPIVGGGLPDSLQHHPHRQSIAQRAEKNKQVIKALLAAAEHEDDVITRMASQIGDCCRAPVFKLCADCGAWHVHQMELCHNRWCVTCNQVRSRKYREHLWQLLNAPRGDQPSYMADPNLKIIKMVLTLKNCSDLVEGINRLNRCMASLRKKYVVLKPVVGAFVSREITHSAEGWHVHAHLIAICDDWLPNRMEDRPYPSQPPGPNNRTPLEDAWLRCTGDSFMVHTSLVRTIDDVAQAIKYACKSEELEQLTEIDPALTRELVYGVRGRRLFSTWGCLYGLVNEAAMEAELEAAAVTEDGELLTGVDGVTAIWRCSECGGGVYDLVRKSLMYVLSTGREIWTVSLGGGGGGHG